MTPAEQAGMHVGGFYLLKKSTPISPWWVRKYEGSLVQLTNDDGSSVPGFTLPSGRVRYMNVDPEQHTKYPNMYSLIVLPHDDKAVAKIEQEIV